MKLFVSPHNDDETLFGAFTLLREKPTVVVVFDSFVQPKRGIPNTDWETRREETARACEILGVETVGFCGLSDDATALHPSDVVGDLRSFGEPTEIWAPAWERDGHEQHNLVAQACMDLAAEVECPIVRYLTYTRTGGKSTSIIKVPIKDPRWVGLKLKALSCYESQFHPSAGCVPHFIGRSLEEYYL